eukprot:TRINITY_DN17014_c0_g1_i2.p1 TRINITY_DN17014_c0_g1~~TRINITY_DN17014_c0_g1_i2.p1  ORF type:complete len:643 (+),score=180.94 TRINITY_DN17014_c0_g1_i2:45-1973(+)
MTTAMPGWAGGPPRTPGGAADDAAMRTPLTHTPSRGSADTYHTARAQQTRDDLTLDGREEEGRTLPRPPRSQPSVRYAAASPPRAAHSQGTYSYDAAPSGSAAPPVYISMNIHSPHAQAGESAAAAAGPSAPAPTVSQEGYYGQQAVHGARQCLDELEARITGGAPPSSSPARSVPAASPRRELRYETAAAAAGEEAHMRARGELEGLRVRLDDLEAHLTAPAPTTPPGRAAKGVGWNVQLYKDAERRAPAGKASKPFAFTKGQRRERSGGDVDKHISALEGRLEALQAEYEDVAGSEETESEGTQPPPPQDTAARKERRPSADPVDAEATRRIVREYWSQLAREGRDGKARREESTEKKKMKKQQPGRGGACAERSSLAADGQSYRQGAPGGHEAAVPPGTQPKQPRKRQTSRGSMTPQDGPSEPEGQCQQPTPVPQPQAPSLSGKQGAAVEVAREHRDPWGGLLAPDGHDPVQDRLRAAAAAGGARSPSTSPSGRVVTVTPEADIVRDSEGFAQMVYEHDEETGALLAINPVRLLDYQGAEDEGSPSPSVHSTPRRSGRYSPGSGRAFIDRAPSTCEVLPCADLPPYVPFTSPSAPWPRASPSPNARLVDIWPELSQGRAGVTPPPPDPGTYQPLYFGGR